MWHVACACGCIAHAPPLPGPKVIDRKRRPLRTVRSSAGRVRALVLGASGGVSTRRPSCVFHGFRRVPSNGGAKELRGFATAAHLQIVALVRRVEQIADPFHVDLDIRDFDDELNVRVGVRYALEQRADGARDDAGEVLVADRRPHHRVRLARAGLAVREDRRVVPLQDVLDERHADRVEDVLLRRLGPEDVVERKRERPVVIVRLDHRLGQLQGHLPVVGRLYLRARARTARGEREESGLSSQNGRSRVRHTRVLDAPRHLSLPCRHKCVRSPPCQGVETDLVLRSNAAHNAHVSALGSAGPTRGVIIIQLTLEE